MRIDLHTHSAVSDGTQAPAALLASAAEAGLDVVALTDHDTTRGWAEAEAAAEDLGIGLVRGMEISCSRWGRSIHLLGYLFDPAHEGLTAEIERARESRRTRMDRMVARMAADGIPITIEEVRAHLAPGATLGRPHLADAMVAKGIVPDRAAAFRDFLHDESPYYVSHYAVDPVRGVELVRAAGGVAVIAHPLTRSLGRAVDVDVIEEMIAAGMAGIEVHHRDHGREQVEHARSIARQHDLIITGSSDYHGTGKPNRLGEHTTDPGALDALAERARGVPVLRSRRAS